MRTYAFVWYRWSFTLGRITTYNVTLDLSFYFRQFSSLVRVSRCTRLPFSSAMGKSGKGEGGGGGGGRKERKVAPTTSAKNNAPVCVSSLLFFALTLQRSLLYLFFFFSSLRKRENSHSKRLTHLRQDNPGMGRSLIRIAKSSEEIFQKMKEIGESPFFLQKYETVHNTN